MNQGLQLHLEGFDWGDHAFFGETYMKRRSNYTYYLRILDAAKRYAPSAKSVIDVGAPWPYVTAFDCEYVACNLVCEQFCDIL
jgi:hypothetical protein